ncbi:MAG: ABC transporter substrate-binding protein [Ilumatobacteraceae bacterium]
MKTSLRRASALTCGALLLICAAACSSDSSKSSTSTNASASSTPASSSAASTQPSGPAGTTNDPSTSDGPSEGTPQRGGDLRIAYSTEPTSLDPSKGSSGNDYMSLYPLYDTLLTYTPELVPQPGLAKSWTWVDDTTLELTLNEGIRFTDGTPFDADAVKVNIEHYKSDTSNWKADLASVDSVEVVSADVVRFHLNTPDAALLMMLADRAGMMMSPASLAAQGDDYQNPVGAGPFKLVEYKPGISISFTRNDDYWQNGLPYLDTISVQFMKDDQAKLNALKSGQVDFLPQLDSSAVEQLKGQDKLTVLTRNTISFDMCYINKLDPPFNDVRVRQAINYATDRDALNLALNGETGEVAWMPWPSDFWAYQADLVPTYPYDPEKAKQLLADAGYPDGLTITGVVNPGLRQSLKNEVLQAQWAKVGIDLKLNVVEIPVASPAFFEKHDHNIYCSGASGRIDPSLALQQLYGKDSYLNVGHADFPGLGDAIAATRAGATPEDRMPALNAAAKIATESAMIAPLVFIPAVDAFGNNVHGFEQTLLNRSRMTDVWISH